MKKYNSGKYLQANVNHHHNSKVLLNLKIDLIEKLLTANPKDRITLDEICKHPWLND